MPVARAIHLWLAGMRTAVYAWLEEVRFRTGILALAGSAAIAGCATAAAIVAAQGGSPAAVHRSLAGQARPAAPAFAGAPAAAYGAATPAAARCACSTPRRLGQLDRQHH
jgi:hypothetical protein